MLQLGGSWFQFNDNIRFVLFLAKLVISMANLSLWNNSSEPDTPPTRARQITNPHLGLCLIGLSIDEQSLWLVEFHECSTTEPY